MVYFDCDSGKHLAPQGNRHIQQINAFLVKEFVMLRGKDIEIEAQISLR
jgi:hypothetical protein